MARMPSPAPPPLDLVADSRSWPRRCARASILLPFAAPVLMAIAQQVAKPRDPAVGEAIYLIASWTAMLLILAALALGVAGLVGGRRRGSRDTMMIAGIGLFVSGGLFLLSVWVNVFVALAR
jgi:hypothetical protein